MADIVDELRTCVPVAMMPAMSGDLVRRAADEIEQLRAEIARLHDRYWMLEKSDRDSGGEGIPSHLR